MFACAYIFFTFVLQVKANVKATIDSFDFAVDKCGVTRTVLVDSTRTGPFQASINRIDNEIGPGYLNRANLEV
jgi:hypothetical protein